MKAELTVGQTLKVEGRKYRISGIDTYKLANIYEKTREWVSYTLIDIEDEDKKVWLGYGFAGDDFIKQWLISEEEFRKYTAELPLNGELTGIANIIFAGDQGYSVPNSEIIWYNDTSDEHDFFVIERFIEIEGTFMKTSKSYYHQMKILKNVTVE